MWMERLRPNSARVAERGLRRRLVSGTCVFEEGGFCEVEGAAGGVMGRVGEEEERISC